MSCGFCSLSERRLMQRLSVHMKTLSKPKTKAISVRRERSTDLCREGKGNRRFA
jgi:hypothetical protein